MNKFRTLALSMVALGGLALAGCEKRAPNADPQGKGYVASQEPAATTPAPAPPAPAAASDDRQPVAGRDMAVAGSDLYWVDADGKRSMLHDTALLTQIQQRLAADGVYRGPNDGRTSPELAAAIRQFQAKKGLAETGAIDRTTADAMGLDWNKLSASTATGSGDTLGDKAERGAAKVGDGVDKAAAETETGAKNLGREVEAGAKDMGRELETGANKVGAGAKEVGRDIEAGTKEAGRDLESGAKELGRDIEKGANEAGRKIDESVK